MKTLVWNVRRANHKRDDVWNYCPEIDPDIAFLQEVGSFPLSISNSYDILQRRAYVGNGKQQNFSTSVLIKGSINSSYNFLTPWEWVNEELHNFAGDLIECFQPGKKMRILCKMSLLSCSPPKRTAIH
jgi:hypothetical protein